MKKIVLLMALPALMVLSSCSVGPKAKDAMIEDTVAHEEVFGEAKEIGSLGVKKLNRSASDLIKPKIGVQYRSYSENETNYLAVRYVAAVATMNVTATWHKAVVTGAGSELMSLSSIETTTAYAAVNDGGVVTEPSDYGEEYNYFVVYTLRKIPEDKADNYVMAYLTLSDGENTVSSDAAVTKIENSDDSFSFDSAETGFFLTGKINGTEGSSVAADSNTRGENAASFTADLSSGDNFVVVQKTNDHFKMWDGNCLGDSGNGFAGGAKISVDSSKKYVVYLNGLNGIYHTQYGNGVNWCVRGTASVGNWNNQSEDSSYRLVYDPDNNGILLSAHLAVGDFKVAHLSDWNDEKGWSYLNNGGANDGEHIVAGASDNNLYCAVAGTYNIYLNSDWRLYIELVSEARISLKNQANYAHWTKVGDDYLLEIEGYYRGEAPTTSDLSIKNDDGANSVACSSITTNNGEFTAQFDVYSVMKNDSVTVYYPHLFVNDSVYFGSNGDLGKDVKFTISDTGFITSENKVVSIVDNSWGFFTITEVGLNIGSASNCKPALSNADNGTDLLFSINVTTDTETIQYTDLPKVAGSIVNPEVITLFDSNWSTNGNSTSRDGKLLRVTFVLAQDGVLIKNDSSVREDIYPHVKFNDANWDGNSGNIPTSGDTSYYFKHEGGFIRYGDTNSYYGLARQSWGTFIRRIDHISFVNHFSVDGTNRRFEIGFKLEKADNSAVKLAYDDSGKAITDGWTGEGSVFNNKFTIDSWFDGADDTSLTVHNIWFNEGEYHALFLVDNSDAYDHEYNNGNEFRMDARLNFDGSPVTSDGKVTCWSDSENWASKGTISNVGGWANNSVEFFNNERYLRIVFKR